MKQVKLLTENRAKFIELLRPDANTDCFMGDFRLKKGFCNDQENLTFATPPIFLSYPLFIWVGTILSADSQFE